MAKSVWSGLEIWDLLHEDTVTLPVLSRLEYKGQVWNLEDIDLEYLEIEMEDGRFDFADRVLIWTDKAFFALPYDKMCSIRFFA